MQFSSCTIGSSFDCGIYLRRLLFLLFLAVTPAVAQETPPEVLVSHVPDIGVLRTVSAGTPIHEYARTYSFDAYVPDAEMKGGRWLLPLVVPANTPLSRVASKAKLKACIENGPCGLDDDGDGAFDRMAEDDISRALKLKTPIPYKKRRVTVNNPDSLRQVIIYAGASSDSIRLSYREFSNDLARPAFTEDLLIPINKIFPQDVAVKAVKIRIHGIDGLGLRYEILP